MKLVQKPNLVVETKVSSYEQTSAWLTAVVTIIGIMVLLGFLIWLLSIFSLNRTEAVAITEFPGKPGEEAPEGEAEDFEEPGVEEFPEVEVPQLADALEAVTDAVSSIQGRLERVDGSAALMGKGTGLGHRDGGGEGGTGGAPWDRWVVEYTSSDLRTYAQQLTFFQIQVGVVSRRTPRIDLISNLTTTPISQTTTRRQEKRVFFSHSNARLRRWDEKLANRAGIKDLAGRFIVQFYPRRITNILAQLEAKYAAANGKNLKNVTRTTFKVRDNGGRYEYYVDSME